MLFEKEKYYKYIGVLEKIIDFSYIIYIVIFSIIGLICGKGSGMIIGGIVGFLLAKVYTINTKIKVQEMKWKMDIYERIK